MRVESYETTAAAAPPAGLTGAPATAVRASASRAPRLWRLRRWLLGPAFPLALLGFAAVLGFWYAAVDGVGLWRFTALPSPVDVWHEWTSENPAFGTSLFTHNYYQDIWASCRRVLLAF